MSARNVIVAVDQSEESNYALTWALENYVKEEDHVELVFAQPDPEESIVVASGGLTLTYADILPRLEAMAQEEASRFQENMAKVLEEKGVKNFDIQVIRGFPRDVLTERAEAVRPSALIMGSRGLGTMQRMFLGSVSDYCVRHCHCPVIIIKKPQE